MLDVFLGVLSGAIILYFVILLIVVVAAIGFISKMWKRMML